MLAIRLPEDLEKRLTRLAKKTGRTKTQYAREAIMAHIDDLEDYYLAERISAEIKSGKQRTYTLEQVLREHELED